MPVLRGVAHVHSRLSYDGSVDLFPLCDRFRRAGLDFVLVSEHNDGLDARRVESLRHLCAEATRDGLLVLPGMELRCRGNLHLLAFGRAFHAPVGLPLEEAVARARAEGAVAVLAHPPPAHERIPEPALRGCDGVEVWNGKRDPRWFVARRELGWVRELRRRGFGLHAFAGLDFHAAGDPVGVELRARVAARKAEALLAALRGGAFTIAAGPFRYEADGRARLVTSVGSASIERIAYPAYAQARRTLRQRRQQREHPERPKRTDRSDRRDPAPAPPAGGAHG